MGRDRGRRSAPRTANHRGRRRHRASGTRARFISLRRALTKPHVRLVAVDDGRFRRTDRRAPICAVVVSLPNEVEAVRIGSVEVDGIDATERIVELIEATGHGEDLRAVLLDGTVVGGFNVVDLNRLHRATRLPVICVTRREPDRVRIRRALVKWFPRDGRARWRKLAAHRLFPVPTGALPIRASVVGATRRDARALLARATRRGYWPEPLRLAHLIASARARTVPWARAKH